MNEKEVPRDRIEDKNSSTSPESEFPKKFMSLQNRIMGKPIVIIDDHTKPEGEPNQKRQTDPDILDRMRRDIESQKIRDSVSLPPRKARDPYDVFRPHKNHMPKLPHNTEEEMSEEEKKIRMRHVKERQEIEIRFSQITTQSDDIS